VWKPFAAASVRSISQRRTLGRRTLRLLSLRHQREPVLRGAHPLHGEADRLEVGAADLQRIAQRSAVKRMASHHCPWPRWALPKKGLSDPAAGGAIVLACFAIAPAVAAACDALNVTEY